MKTKTTKSLKAEPVFEPFDLPSVTYRAHEGFHVSDIDTGAHFFILADFDALNRLIKERKLKNFHVNLEQVPADFSY